MHFIVIISVTFHVIFVTFRHCYPTQVSLSKNSQNKPWKIIIIKYCCKYTWPNTLIGKITEARVVTVPTTAWPSPPCFGATPKSIGGVQGRSKGLLHTLMGQEHPTQQVLVGPWRTAFVWCCGPSHHSPNNWYNLSTSRLPTGSYRPCKN